MINKTIQDYIQFGIDNGYEGTEFHISSMGEYVCVLYQDKYVYEGEVIRLITSKEFIEAVVKGLKEKRISIENRCISQGKISRARILGNVEYNIDSVTYFQAIAIRDGNMEEFINNLLLNE